jgi:hypothetical protein
LRRIDILKAPSSPEHSPFGHPLTQDPAPGRLHMLMAERNYFRRALAAAVDGNEKMAWAAGQCARMRMTHPEEAIRYLRELHFPGWYRDLPLTQIEQDMVRQGTAFLTLLAYRIIVKSIERELIGLAQAQRSSAAAPAAA